MNTLAGTQSSTIQGVHKGPERTYPWHARTIEGGGTVRLSRLSQKLMPPAPTGRWHLEQCAFKLEPRASVGVDGRADGHAGGAPSRMDFHTAALPVIQLRVVRGRQSLHMPLREVESAISKTPAVGL